MTADDFRRIALAEQNALEGSHRGQADFRVGGHIFATLANVAQGLGNLKLTPEQQSELLREWPEWFLPVGGAWGRNGMTHVRLAEVPEAVLHDSLHAAWRLVSAESAARAARPKRTSRTKR